MDRATLIDRIMERLGKRNLVWAGIRGDDIEPLADIPQLSASFSIIGQYSNRATIESLAYENLTHRRVDLETWDIDDHLHDEATHVFRRALLQALVEPSAMLPYRASRFLSSICFARRDRTPQPRALRRAAGSLRAQALGRDVDRCFGYRSSRLDLRGGRGAATRH